MATPLFNNIEAVSFGPEQRSEAEMRWVGLQPYLLSRGYCLRPRYQPDWVPSWSGTNIHPADCEDSINLVVSSFQFIITRFDKQTPY